MFAEFVPTRLLCINDRAQDTTNVTEYDGCCYVLDNRREMCAVDEYGRLQLTVTILSGT